ncbi:hypothetical protein [Caldifermentibacillus hisashii]|uniref:hypothetical protein n=1 Tax=Caldifermentibacillus hisashii TaxID=996558 RepID=UPI0030F3F029
MTTSPNLVTILRRKTLDFGDESASRSKFLRNALLLSTKLHPVPNFMRMTLLVTRNWTYVYFFQENRYSRMRKPIL